MFEILAHNAQLEFNHEEATGSWISIIKAMNGKQKLLNFLRLGKTLKTDMSVKCHIESRIRRLESGLDKGQSRDNW